MLSDEIISALISDHSESNQALIVYIILFVGVLDGKEISHLKD